MNNTVIIFSKGQLIVTLLTYMYARNCKVISPSIEADSKNVNTDNSFIILLFEAILDG